MENKTVENIVEQTKAEENKVVSVNTDSYGGGFALGFFLNLIGVVVALMVGGEQRRRGCGYGLLTSTIIALVISFIVYLATFGS
jgi:nitrogenase molybdenum-iron protein alpha/beta subunit